MKVNLYTLITVYLFIGAVLSVYHDEFLSANLSDNLYYIIPAALMLTVPVIKIIVKMIKNHFLAVSEIFLQLLIIVVSIFALEFSGLAPILFGITSVILFYLLKISHHKVLIKTYRKAINNLVIRNNFFLTVIYIGYGVFCYGLLSVKPYIGRIFSDAVSLMYYAFFPYIIIILMLYTLQNDYVTDKMNAYQKHQYPQIIKRNIILNLLSLWLLLI